MATEELVVSALMVRMGVTEVTLTMEELVRAPRLMVRHNFMADTVTIRSINRNEVAGELEAPNAD